MTRSPTDGTLPLVSTVHGVRRLRAGALPLLGAALAAFGCQEEDPRLPTGDEEQSELRLGRVHVVLETSDERLAGDEDEPTLAIAARFAYARGLDEDFARARIEMPLLPHDVLGRNQCTSDDLMRAPEAEYESEGRRALVLMDAGELRVYAGDEAVQVPLTLVPDLLPYMAGVEYAYLGDAPSFEGSGTSTIVVEAEGASLGAMPGFAAEAVVPSNPDLAFDLTLDRALDRALDPALEIDRDALVIRWGGTVDPTLPVTVRLLPTEGGEPIADELTCVFDDEGQVRLDLGVLRELGLPARADQLLVSLSRTAVTNFDAGDFKSSELVIERRSTSAIDLR